MKGIKTQFHGYFRQVKFGLSGIIKTPSSVQNCYEVEFTGIKQKFDHRGSVKKGLGRIFTHSETSLAVFFYAMLSISLRTTWIA